MPKEDHDSSDRSDKGLPQGGVELSLDELAKGLATGTLSSGKAIRWMGGALLGAALASVPGVAWANDCRRLGRECRRDSQCCSKNCIGRGDDKVCGCPEGKTRCKDRCVNLKTNENHCGSCSNRFEEGQECIDGVCSGGEPICNPPCPEGEECVHGTCCPNAQVCSTLTTLTCCAEGEDCIQGGVCQVCPPAEPVCTGCACETLACTDTCNPNTISGGVCYDDADGVGTICVCGFAQCTDDCSGCTSLGLTCALADPTGCGGAQFQCVAPC
jgi:hypothetical protein